MEHVEELGGRHLIPVDGENEIRMLGEVLDRLFRNALGQLNGNDLLLVRDHHSGVADDQIQRRECCLNALDPFGINALAHELAGKVCGGLRGANQHLRVGKVGALLGQLAKGGVRLRFKIIVLITHCGILLSSEIFVKA